MSVSVENRQIMRDILRKAVARVIPVKWRSSSPMPSAGERRSYYRGQGDDYDGTSPYKPGDDTRKIAWNHYATTGGEELLVNRYREERDIKAFLLVDVSRSMNFGTHRVTKRHLACELAASALVSLDETRDRVGMVLYSANKVEKYIPTRAATRMKLPLANILEQEQSTDGTGDGLAKALKVLPNSRALVYIISDFMNMTPADWDALRRVGRHHDVRCFFVQDLRERELPDVSWGSGPVSWLTGLLGCFYTLQDSSGERKVIWVNKKTRARYAANFRQHEAGIVARLKDSRVRSCVVSTEEGDHAFPKIIKALGGHR